MGCFFVLCLGCSGTIAGTVEPVPEEVAQCGREVSRTIDFQPIGVPSSTGAPATADTVDVVSHGARGDDQIDDTEAFAEALASLPQEGGVLLVPEGIFLLKASENGINRAIDLSNRSNIKLAGAGMEQTILRMAPASYTTDTHVILLERASGITIQNLTIDGNRANVSYQNEQSHGVELRGSSNIRFERVFFTGMHGDGIRLLGLTAEERWVKQVLVKDSRFDNNGRSGVAVQRGVKEVEITGSSFTRISDQAIDMEPSNAEGVDIAPRDFSITNNVFSNTAGLAVTVSGIGVEKPARRVVVADNELEGTSILVFNAHDVRIQRNIIRSADRSPIVVQKASRNVWIQDNQIDDARRTLGESAVQLLFHNGCAPTDVQFERNTVHAGIGRGFYARDSERVSITRNRFVGAGSEGIMIEDIVPDSPLSDFLIQHNEIDGFTVGVRIQSREDTMSHTCVFQNTFLNLVDTLEVRGPIDFRCIQ